MANKDFKNLIGIWKNKGDDGKTFFNGSFAKDTAPLLAAIAKDPTQFRISFFPNDFKAKNPKGPDYKIYVAKKKPRTAPPPTEDPFGESSEAPGPPPGDDDPFADDL